jgi:Ferritin-like domain
MTARCTRGGLLRGAAGAGAALAGGTLVARTAGGTSSLAAPSAESDERLLNFFLLLERIHEGFYAAAVERAAIGGELLRYAMAAQRQESDHVALLRDRLGDRADAPPATDYGDAVADSGRFSAAAIQLEEATLGAYIGHGADLTRDAVAAIVPLVSVEARQAAWIRDLAHEHPAPRAADPARKPDDVMATLRDLGFVK